MVSEIFPGQGVGTFWARGKLAPLDVACLTALRRRGVPVTVFSYEKLEGVPDGVLEEDAANLVPEAMTHRFMAWNKPSDLGHFSDLFRHRMITQRHLTWVDLDVILVGEGKFSHLPNLVVREEQGGLNGAVLYVSEPALAEVLGREIEACMDRNLAWGESGPVALRKAVQAVGAWGQTVPYETFYPIEHYDVWRVLLPEEREFCERKCGNSTGVHLFNNILHQIGYWKQIAPPVGSYLHDALARNDALGLFTDVYPEKVMRAVVGNFLSSRNGELLGAKQVVRQLLPSIRRSYSHIRGPRRDLAPNGAAASAG